MDYATHWKQFSRENADIEGGALIGTDGVLISGAKFGGAEDSATYIAQCATAITIASQLIQDAAHSEFEALILEGELGYIVLMPILDKAILAVLARKRAKLGLLLLDMKRAIDDGAFGPGLAAEPIFPLRPPKLGRAYAKPEHD